MSASIFGCRVDLESPDPKVIDSPPEIWLVYGDITEDCKHSECSDVSWCEKSQFPSDVKYVRADIAGAAPELLAALERIFNLQRDCPCEQARAAIAKAKGGAA